MDPSDDELEGLAPDERRFLEDCIAAGECPECEGHLVCRSDAYHCADCGWFVGRPSSY